MAAALTDIDTHHHFFPPRYVAMKRQEITQPAPFDQTLDWRPEWSLDEMDSRGIRTAILSVSTPGVWFGDVAESRILARSSNEYGAELAALHPGRFGQFASIALPDVEGSLEEIAYALDVLKADGICLMTSYDGKHVGDPAFRRVFDELGARKAVVFFHPTAADYSNRTTYGPGPSSLEFPFDTTRAIVSLMFAGRFADDYGATFIFSHLGGALGSLHSRMFGFLPPEVRAGMSAGPIAALGRHYFDTPSMENPAAMSAIRELVPPSQLLFGTDHPFAYILQRTGQGAVRREGLAGLGFSEAELAGVRHGNAERLLPRLAG